MGFLVFRICEAPNLITVSSNFVLCFRRGRGLSMTYRNEDAAHAIMTGTYVRGGNKLLLVLRYRLSTSLQHNQVQNIRLAESLFSPLPADAEYPADDDLPLRPYNGNHAGPQYLHRGQLSVFTNSRFHATRYHFQRCHQSKCSLNRRSKWRLCQQQRTVPLLQQRQRYVIFDNDKYRPLYFSPSSQGSSEQKENQSRLGLRGGGLICKYHNICLL